MAWRMNRRSFEQLSSLCTPLNFQMNYLIAQISLILCTHNWDLWKLWQKHICIPERRNTWNIGNTCPKKTNMYGRSVSQSIKNVIFPKTDIGQNFLLLTVVSNNVETREVLKAYSPITEWLYSGLRCKIRLLKTTVPALRKITLWKLWEWIVQRMMYPWK